MLKMAIAMAPKKEAGLNLQKGETIETRLTYNCAHIRSTKESLTFEYHGHQGCISCGPCSYPELTEDHVLPSA